MAARDSSVTAEAAEDAVDADVIANVAGGTDFRRHNNPDSDNPVRNSPEPVSSVRNNLDVRNNRELGSRAASSQAILPRPRNYRMPPS
jgi:hypothetical protein